jgi:hypothetical protein
MRWKVGGLLLLSVLCWEIIVRFLVLSPAQEVFEPRLGYIHAPHAHILRTYEGYARFDLDQFGLNNDALPTHLPKIRLFVVGDSFVEAYQVMREENFISHLHEQWQDALLFNAGSSGAAPDTSWTAFDLLQSQVQPTHILLCVNASDLYELLPAQERRNGKGELTGLYRAIDQPSRWTPLKLWLYGHSALITHLKWKYEHDIRAWWTEKNEQQIARKHHELQGKALQGAVERWRFVLQQFQHADIPVTVLMMPELEYLPHQQVRQKIRQGRVVLTQEAERMGIPVLDSNAVFARDFEQTGVPAIGFANTHYGKGHINTHGHQVLADWLNVQRAVILR